MDTLKALTLFFNYLVKCKYILYDHLKSAQEDFLADCDSVEGDLAPAKRKYLYQLRDSIAF